MRAYLREREPIGVNQLGYAALEMKTLRYAAWNRQAHSNGNGHSGNGSKPKPLIDTQSGLPNVSDFEPQPAVTDSRDGIYNRREDIPKEMAFYVGSLIDICLELDLPLREQGRIISWIMQNAYQSPKDVVALFEYWASSRGTGPLVAESRRKTERRADISELLAANVHEGFFDDWRCPH